MTLEPYYKALETSRRCAELGRELNIPHVVGIASCAKTRPGAGSPEHGPIDAIGAGVRLREFSPV